MVLRRERSSGDAPSQAQQEPSSPGFRHPHGHILPAGVRSVLPEEHTGAETRLCHQEGRRAGRPEGTGNRSERSRLPVPAPSLARSFSLAGGLRPPQGCRGGHPVPWSSPARRRGASVSAPGLGGPPGPSCLSCPSLSSLGAEVSGSRSPCVPRADISGPWSPCVPRVDVSEPGTPASLRGRGLGAPVPPRPSGRGLRAPVPPRPSGPRSGGPGPPVSLGAMSRGPGSPASIGAEV